MRAGGVEVFLSLRRGPGGLFVDLCDGAKKENIVGNNVSHISNHRINKLFCQQLCFSRKKKEKRGGQDARDSSSSTRFDSSWASVRTLDSGNS